MGGDRKSTEFTWNIKTDNITFEVTHNISYSKINLISKVCSKKYCLIYKGVTRFNIQTKHWPNSEINYYYLNIMLMKQYRHVVRTVLPYKLSIIQLNPNYSSVTVLPAYGGFYIKQILCQMIGYYAPDFLKCQVCLVCVLVKSACWTFK